MASWDPNQTLWIQILFRRRHRRRTGSGPGRDDKIELGQKKHIGFFGAENQQEKLVPRWLSWSCCFSYDVWTQKLRAPWGENSLSTRRPNLCHLCAVVTAMEPWQIGQIWWSVEGYHGKRVCSRRMLNYNQVTVVWGIPVWASSLHTLARLPKGRSSTQIWAACTPAPWIEALLYYIIIIMLMSLVGLPTQTHLLEHRLWNNDQVISEIRTI